MISVKPSCSICRWRSATIGLFAMSSFPRCPRARTIRPCKPGVHYTARRRSRALAAWSLGPRGAIARPNGGIVTWRPLHKTPSAHPPKRAAHRQEVIYNVVHPNSPKRPRPLRARRRGAFVVVLSRPLTPGWGRRGPHRSERRRAAGRAPVGAGYSGTAPPHASMQAAANRFAIGTVRCPVRAGAGPAALTQMLPWRVQAVAPRASGTGS